MSNISEEHINRAETASHKKLYGVTFRSVLIAIIPPNRAETAFPQILHNGKPSSILEYFADHDVFDL